MKLNKSLVVESMLLLVLVASSGRDRMWGKEPKRKMYGLGQILC